MVSGIIKVSNLAKVGAASALLMGSVAANASNPIKDVSNRLNQTEVVSKAGAEAIKIMNAQNVQQSSIPTTSNQKLNITLMKFAEDQKSKNIINGFLNNIYKQQGTVMGSAFVQHQIDVQMLGVLIDENTDILIKNNINPTLGEKVKSFGPVFYNSVRKNKSDVVKWVQESYTNTIYSLINSNHIQNGKEAIEKLDDVAEHKANFTLDELIDYHTSCDNFKRNHINNRTDSKSLADLAAFKMFMIDKLIIKRSLTNSGFFGPDSKINKYESLIDYYDKWMDSVKPKAK